MVKRVELNISIKYGLRMALDFLAKHIPPELEPEFEEFRERLLDEAEHGTDPIDFAEVVAVLLDPRRFGLKQEVVEDFLYALVRSYPNADSLVAGTILFGKELLRKRRTREDFYS